MRMTLAILTLCLSVVPAAAQSPPPVRPNVVLIVTDDVGYGDIGSYGAPDVKTPSIDSLARDGVQADRLLRGAAMHADPRRADLRPLPAALPARSRAARAEDARRCDRTSGDRVFAAATPEEQRLCDRTDRQVASRLQAAVQPERARLRLLLRVQERIHRLLPAHRRRRRIGPVREPVAGPRRRLHDRSHHRAVDQVHRRSCARRRSSSKSPITRRTGRSRCPIIRRSPPATARFVQPEENDTATRQDYIAILERADQGIGRILQALKRRGLDRNTLVIYMQDNGGEWVSRNAPLFNRKGTVWEGGIRVPAIFRWPGHLPAGKVSGQVGIVQDVTASILAATGTHRAAGGPSGGHQPAADARRKSSAVSNARCSSASRSATPSNSPSARAPGSCSSTAPSATSSICRRMSASAMT